MKELIHSAKEFLELSFILAVATIVIAMACLVVRAIIGIIKGM